MTPLLLHHPKSAVVAVAVAVAAVAELSKAPALAAAAVSPCIAAPSVQEDATASIDAGFGEGLSGLDLAAVAANAETQAGVDQVRSHSWLRRLLYFFVHSVVALMNVVLMQGDQHGDRPDPLTDCARGLEHDAKRQKRSE